MTDRLYVARGSAGMESGNCLCVHPTEDRIGLMVPGDGWWHVRDFPSGELTEKIRVDSQLYWATNVAGRIAGVDVIGCELFVDDYPLTVLPDRPLDGEVRGVWRVTVSADNDLREPGRHVWFERRSEYRPDRWRTHHVACCRIVGPGRWEVVSDLSLQDTLGFPAAHEIYSDPSSGSCYVQEVGKDGLHEIGPDGNPINYHPDADHVTIRDDVLAQTDWDESVAPWEGIIRFNNGRDPIRVGGTDSANHIHMDERGWVIASIQFRNEDRRDQWVIRVWDNANELRASWQVYLRKDSQTPFAHNARPFLCRGWAGWHEVRDGEVWLTMSKIDEPPQPSDLEERVAKLEAEVNELHVTGMRRQAQIDEHRRVLKAMAAAINTLGE